MRGITEAQHKTFLGQAQNECDWGAMCEVLEIQLDSVDARGSHQRRDGGRQRGGRTFRNAAFGADPEEDEDKPESEASGEEGEGEDEDEIEALSADVEELETAMANVDINALSEEEVQTFAAEAQRLGEAIAAKGRGRGKGASSSSNYARQRQFIKGGKTNRGFRRGKTYIDFDGKISFGTKDLQDKLGAFQKKSTCGACGEPGH